MKHRQEEDEKHTEDKFSPPLSTKSSESDISLYITGHVAGNIAHDCPKEENINKIIIKDAGTKKTKPLIVHMLNSYANCTPTDWGFQIFPSPNIPLLRLFFNDNNLINQKIKDTIEKSSWGTILYKDVAYTPLTYAMRIFRYARDSQGDEYFKRLAFHNVLLITETLLEKGADPNVEDHAGKTPLYHLLFSGKKFSDNKLSGNRLTYVGEFEGHDRPINYNSYTLDLLLKSGATINKTIKEKLSQCLQHPEYIQIVGTNLNLIADENLTVEKIITYICNRANHHAEEKLQALKEAGVRPSLPDVISRTIIKNYLGYAPITVEKLRNYNIQQPSPKNSSSFLPPSQSNSAAPSLHEGKNEENSLDSDDDTEEKEHSSGQTSSTNNRSHQQSRTIPNNPSHDHKK